MVNVDHRVRVAAERRQQMLVKLSDATLLVMAQQGPHRTSVDAIIQEAGVSRGTFYKYYDSPACIIMAVGTELAQELITAMAPILDQYDDPAHRLSAAFRTTLQLAKEYSLLGNFLIRAGWPVNDQVTSFTERATANIHAGIALNRFRKLPISVALATLGGILMGTLGALNAETAEPNIELEASVALLTAFGISEAEARRIASVPLELPPLRKMGLLARSQGSFETRR